jgi:hypothetical protein
MVMSVWLTIEPKEKQNKTKQTIKKEKKIKLEHKESSK